MNMGLEWIPFLRSAGHHATHWSSIGQSDDTDEQIMHWARDNACIVLTADLDFGARLIRRDETGPSVVQLRTDDTLVRLVGRTVIAAIEQTQTELTEGALVTVENERYRIRRLTPPDNPRAPNG